MIDNAVLDAIRARRSIRNFSSEPVTDQELEALLEAGRWAPSGLNSQPWDFVVVRDPEARHSMAQILRRVTVAWGGFSGAPATIVVSVDRSRDPDHFVEDGAVAAQNICLAAHSMGLASSWAGIYSGQRRNKRSAEHSLKVLLGIPETHSIIAVIPVGHGNGEDTASRVPLAEMVHHDRFRSGARYR